MLLVDGFLIPQDLYESEDELLSLKTQSLVSTKLHLVPMCDVSPIQPRKLREAEHLKLGFDMEKLLLERVVLRKELKLQRMQEKLLDLKEKQVDGMWRLAWNVLRQSNYQNCKCVWKKVLFPSDSGKAVFGQTVSGNLSVFPYNYT